MRYLLPLLSMIFAFTAFSAQSAAEYEIEAPPIKGADTLFVTEQGDTITKAQLDSIQQSMAVEKMPELKAFIKAEYPAADLKNGVEGSVLLDLFVSDSGRVDSLHLVRSLKPSMDSAAMKVIKRFEFTPAMAGNRPVPVIIQYEYRFSISEEVKDLEEYVNLKGVLKEMGTRAPIRDAELVAAFPDSASDSTIRIPWSAYLSKIGSFAGQSLDNGKIITTTDSLGRFQFKSLPAGFVKITFPVAGYKAAMAMETIEHAREHEVEYYLERMAYNEYEIVIYGKIEKQEVAKNTLTLAEVKRVPGFGGDAVKVVQALPGVARASYGMGQVVVRGSANGDTRYFLDGVQIPALFHFGGLRSTYNSDALSNIDLYPGGFNVRYGGAVGGIVEIKGRPAKLDRWHGNVDVNLIDASFLAEGPLSPRLSLMTTARRSYIADVAAFVIKRMGIYFPMTVVPYYWDVVTRLDFKKDKRNRMFWTLFLTRDNMKFITQEIRGGSTAVSSAQNEISMDITSQLLLYGWDSDISDRLKNELRLSLNRGTTDFNFGGYAKMTLTSYGPYLRDQVSYKLTDEILLSGGVDAMGDSIDYQLNSLDALGVSLNRNRNIFSDLSAYTEADVRPLKTLSIKPGLRYDYFTEIGEGSPSLRLTTRWDWKPKHTLKGAVGNYSQAPQPQGQAIDSVWGNPDLPPTKAKQAVLGYEYQFSDLLSIDAQTYFNYQSQIPMATDSVSPVSHKPYHYLAAQEGRMYGLEVMLRHNQSEHFFGWISYSLSRSERRSPWPDNPGMGGASSTNLKRAWNPKKWYLYSKDQTHNLQLIGSWRLNRNWEVGGRARYVTGNPDTPRLGYTQHRFEWSGDEVRYVRLLGEENSDRMGPFFQLDARVDKKFIFKKWMLSTYLDIQNMNYFLYNSPESYGYNYDATERQVIGGIIIPSLGIRAEF